MKRLVVSFILITLVLSAMPALAQGPDSAGLEAISRLDLTIAGIEIVAESLEMNPVDLLITLAAEQGTLSQAIADAEADAETIKSALVDSLGLEPEAAQVFLDTPYPLSVGGAVFGEMGFAMPGEDTVMVEPLTQLVLLVAARGGLTLMEIRERMENGESLREIALSAGLDPDELLAVVTERIAGANERLNTEGIRSVEEPGVNEAASFASAAFASSEDILRARFQRTVVVNLVVTGAIADALGVSRLEVRTGVPLGETYEEYIVRMGGDVEAVQAAAAEDLITALENAASAGLISEDDADLMAKSADAAAADMLGRVLRYSLADPFGVLDEE